MVDSEFSSSIGALYLSNSFSMLLLGLLISKAFDYAIVFHNDRLIFKFIVATMVVLSLGETVSYCVWGWDWSVRHYGDPVVMAFIPLPLPVVTLCWTFAILINQLFFAWRLYVISKSKIILAVIISGSVYQQGFMYYMSAPEWSGTELIAALKDRIYPAAYSWVAVGTAVDVLITSAMFYYLGFRRRQPQMASSVSVERLLRGIFWRTIQYNALSLVVQSIEYSLFLTSTSTGLWFCLGNSIMVKFLTFSVLMSLMARRTHRVAGLGPQLTFGSTTDGTSPSKRSAPRQNFGVNVSVETNRALERTDWPSTPSAIQPPVPVHFDRLEREGKYPESMELGQMV